MKKSFRNIFIALSIFSSSTVLLAQDNFFKDLITEKVISTDTVMWTQIGPGSQGGADSSIFHPTDPNWVYISQNMQNTYVSTDNMSSHDTWSPITDDDINGRPYNIGQVYQMDFSRQDENLGFAVSAFGLWKSTDKGLSWTRTSLDIFQEPSRTALSAIEFDPNDDNIIYVGVGEFWDNIDPRTLKKQQKNTSKLKVTGTIFKSIDQGQTWKAYTTGLPRESEIGQIFVDPRNSNVVYVATSHGVYVSEDGGHSYESRNEGFETGILRDMDMHYDKETDQLTLYATELTIWSQVAAEEAGKMDIESKGGAYISKDGGFSWQSITSDSLYVDFSQFGDQSTLTGAYGFFKNMEKWFNESTTKLQAKINLPEKILPNFREIEVDPTNPDRIYLLSCSRKEYSVGPEGVWMTEDGGQNWFISTRVGQYGKTGPGTYGPEEDVEYLQSLYAPPDVNLTEANVSVGGESAWSHMYALSYPQLAIQFLDVSPDGKTLITHVFKSRVASFDYGRTWTQVDAVEIGEPGSGYWVGRGNSNIPGKFLLADPITQDMRFIVGETGIWEIVKDIDYSHLNTTNMPVAKLDPTNSVPCPTSAIAYDPIDGNKLYALVERLGHAGEFVKSEDGGKSWQSVSNFLEQVAGVTADASTSIKAYTLIIDKNNTNNMYFAMPISIINDTAESGENPVAEYKRGVFKSTDAGKTWSLANNGLPFSPNINAVAFNPDNTIIYAAAMKQGKNTGGLFMSKDGAESWSKILLPYGITAVNDVTISSSGRIVISTGEGSRLSAIDGVWISDDEGTTWEQIFKMPTVIETFLNPNNPERMIVNVDKNSAIDSINCGLYYTSDEGKTWEKINQGLGNPDKILEVMFDPIDPNVVWCASQTSGFYKGVISE
ncbi:MAG: hypothetical protein ATN31_01985 [Candidatus Epulonipiscioides saccharophilum]|nr:MAG: hypothetical protein ATN31_01985 [Epulopiscium sp. AS2M-Bin001]